MIRATAVSIPLMHSFDRMDTLLICLGLDEDPDLHASKLQKTVPPGVSRKRAKKTPHDLPNMPIDILFEVDSNVLHFPPRVLIDSGRYFPSSLPETY